jgi:hypothetical protein
LRKECRLRISENRVLRRICGPTRDEVTGEWRRLHNKELHALNSSSNIIRAIKSRRLRWAEHVARMGDSSGAYGVLMDEPEGKRPLKRSRHLWEDNIKIYLRDVDGSKDLIDLAWDRNRWRAVVNAVMNLEVS